MTGDTIVALSTPAGPGAIGVLRLSGPGSLPLCRRVFRPAGQDSGGIPARTAVTGDVIRPEDGAFLDRAVLVFYPSPASYTGEDVAELSCHGNPLLLNEIRKILAGLGARPAKPGEFTERAYLNGKLDLPEAEAVNDLIRAHTAYALAQAAGQLQGRLSQRISEIHSRILDILSRLEAAIDHGDLGETAVAPEELVREILKTRDSIGELLRTAPAGRMTRDGLRLVITGAPNTGKSSLMNLLLQEDRVIVSETPGTTRDTVEDELNIRGIPVRVVDTAGIRETPDALEQSGIDRARRAVETADLVIMMFDSSRPVSGEDRLIWTEVRDRRTVCVLSKTDLPRRTDLGDLKKEFGVEAIPVSVPGRTGLTRLEDAVAEFYDSFGYDPAKDVLVTNVRQEHCLEKARDHLERAAEAARQGLSEEFAAADIRKARLALEEISGRTTDDAVLDRIFSRFCIGK